MMTARSEMPSVVCAENIAVLSVLHTVPLPPSANAIHPSLAEKSDTSSRSLSIEQERHLVGALSFLAGITDNPNDVAAVCIQEMGKTLATKSLQLLIAVNQAGEKRTRPCVQKIKEGFEGVLQPLHSIQTGDDGAAIKAVEGQVFSAIIAMCNQRILQRLRLIPNGRKKERQPFQSILEQAMNSVKKTKAARKKYRCLIEQARVVMEQFTGLAGYQVESQVKRLVEGIHALYQTQDVCNVILAIPDYDMPPDLRESLVSTISKVARYQDIAQLLCRMAAHEDRTLVRKWSVVPVELPPSAFVRTDAPGQPPGFPTAMSRACGRAQVWPSGELESIFRCLGTLQHDASISFKKTVSSVLVESRVHAEIQLIAYCELRRKLLVHSEAETLPRVIRSHKAACYLCNLFITACFPTTYFTSRSHGRLYPGWRLPQCFSADVSTRFNAVLAEQIKEGVGTLQRRKAKTNYVQPAESELTILPLLPEEDVEEVEGNAIQPSETENAQPAEMVETVAPDADTPKEAPAVSHTLSDLASICLSLEEAPAMLADSPMSPRASRTDKCRPQPSADDLLSSSRIRVHDSTSSPFCRVGGLELQVEYDRQHDKRDLSFVAEQLSHKEVKRLGMDQLLRTTDVGRLPPGSAVGGLSVDGQGCVYLAVDGSVYRVSFVFSAPGAPLMPDGVICSDIRSAGITTAGV